MRILLCWLMSGSIESIDHRLIVGNSNNSHSKEQSGER